MSSQLVSSDLLQKADKILFISHFAIGDYVYWQNCFEAFHHAYPHVRIHVWVDEVRRTSDPAKWDGLRNYVLYDWMEATPFFEKVYRHTWSHELYRQSVREAMSEAYPLVISLANLRPHKYARLARAIGRNAFVAGLRKPLTLFTLHHAFDYKKLDALINPNRSRSARHISEIYADWFNQLFGIEMNTEQCFPFVDIPLEWLERAEDFLRAWGVDRTGDQVIFINAFAKTKKRSWPLEKVMELISAMRNMSGYGSAWFLINCMPGDLDEIKQFIRKNGIKQARPFCANENFFQLPAMLSLCSLIISVETSVMHLANAVRVPVIALMRSKNPQWAPFDADNSSVVMAAHRRDWVKEISVGAVLDELQKPKASDAVIGASD